MTSPNPARHLNRRRVLIGSALAALCASGVAVAGAQGGSSDKVMLPDGKFPVRGKHQYWDGFGAGRGHTGQDIGADCGTKIVAAQTGRVVEVARGAGGYGNYAVVNVSGSNRANFYAHMKSKAVPPEGSKVHQGDRFGRVGQTGNATGCHLHFEYWRGTYPDGHPTRKVTKVLRHWDRNS